MPDSEPRYAVSLWGMANLTREIEHLPILLLLKDIVTETVINTQAKQFTSQALLVRNDVPTDQWQAICTLVRMRIPRWELPLFERVNGCWRYVREMTGDTP